MPSPVLSPLHFSPYRSPLALTRTSETNSFDVFFSQIDHFRNDQYLYLTSAGITAATRDTVRTTSGNAKNEGTPMAPASHSEETKAEDSAKRADGIDSEDEHGAEDGEG
ncbi:MAG: hypothetical protein M1837_006210 [Sclerophora amabilis]|nr:MAG: hypothetical protein M1837_006210 [Sclerophora amabilis]